MSELMIERLRHSLSFLCVAVFLSACAGQSQMLDAAPATSALAEAAPKRVVLVVADGFGVSHLSALSIALRDSGGSVIESMPVLGLVRTSSASNIVTDSAAGASAYATGERVANRALSVRRDGEALPTMAEKAAAIGWGVGVATTSYVIDATPMAFLAHAGDRYDRETVAAQLPRFDVDLLVGNDRHLPAGTRDAAAEQGYTVVDSLAAGAGIDEKLLVLLRDPGAESTEHPEARFPRIADFAMRHLDRSHESFFLLLEHEGTDTFSHSNSADALLEVLLSIEDAMVQVLDFARADGETLVVFLADHETGGLYITEEPAGTLKMEFGRGGHTAQHIPLFAYGPGSDRFAGVHDNAVVGRVLMKLIGER